MNVFLDILWKFMISSEVQCYLGYAGKNYSWINTACLRKRRPSKYWKICCFRQSSPVNMSNCHIIYQSLAKTKQNETKQKTKEKTKQKTKQKKNKTKQKTKQNKKKPKTKQKIQEWFLWYDLTYAQNLSCHFYPVEWLTTYYNYIKL